MRQTDGSAGDANYGAIGASYTAYRRPEPFIETMILHALGEAGSVLDVGAGAGSYEAANRNVTALEPSASRSIFRLRTNRFMPSWPRSRSISGLTFLPVCRRCGACLAAQSLSSHAIPHWFRRSG
jgi:hypothetical protein